MITESDLKKINRIAFAINDYISERLSKEYSKDEFEALCCYIMFVLSKWTGETWIGCPKDEKIERTFQNFFETMYRLIGYIDCFSVRMSEDEKEFANKAAYHGIIYRYLGSNIPGNKDNIEIQYNDIYVSWSKNEKNSYIEGKLYGPCIWIKAQIAKCDFGIDLEGIEKFYQKFTGNSSYVVKGQEREVVYPTKRESILKVI